MPLVQFLHLPTRLSPDPDETLAELTAAIDLVASGLAARVVLTNLGGIESVTPAALARAQASNVAFTVDPGLEGRLRVVIGPRAG
jgi:hypothetical protein